MCSLDYVEARFVGRTLPDTMITCQVSQTPTKLEGIIACRLLLSRLLIRKDHLGGPGLATSQPSPPSAHTPHIGEAALSISHKCTPGTQGSEGLI